jgi:hypothetical protein
MQAVMAEAYRRLDLVDGQRARTRSRWTSGKSLYLRLSEGLKGSHALPRRLSQKRRADGRQREGEQRYESAGEGLARGQIVQVTDDVIGKKRKLVTGCGTLHCIAMFDPKTGALLEAYSKQGLHRRLQQLHDRPSRMISMSARAASDIYTIVDQLNSTGSCPSYAVRSATKMTQAGARAARWPWATRCSTCTTRCRKSWARSARRRRNRNRKRPRQSPRPSEDVREQGALPRVRRAPGL